MKKKLIFSIIVLLCSMMSAVSIWAQTDMTSHITNPSFEEGTMNGWTVYRGAEIDQGAAGSKLVADFPLTNADGQYICDYYGWAWSWDPFNGLKQTVSDLPAGEYNLKAVLGGWAGWTLRLDANGTYQEKVMTADNAGTEFSVTFTLDGETDLVISASTSHVNHNSWEACFMKADNFRLTFFGDEPFIRTKAIALPGSTAALTADQWDYDDVPADGDYTVSSLSSFVYTIDGDDSV